MKSIKFNKMKNELLTSTSGSILPIYALSAVAVVTIVGFTIDFRRADNAKTRMQDAVDASVLAAAKEYLDLRGELSDDGDAYTDAEREALASQVANDYFQANLVANQLLVGDPSIALSFDPETGEVTATGVGELGMVFGGFVGKENLALTVDASAIAGDARRVEIVLALDNSTSMFVAGGGAVDSSGNPINRMTLMTEAATGFVDTIMDNAVAANSAQIGVVPWAASVNILGEKPLEFNGTTPSAFTISDRLQYLYPPKSYSGSYTVSQMERDFAPTQWRGCITAAHDERKLSSSAAVVTSLTADTPETMKWPALLVPPEIRERWVRVENPSYVPPAPTPSSPSPAPAPGPTPKPKPKPTFTPIGGQSSLDVDDLPPLGPQAPVDPYAPAPTPSPLDPILRGEYSPPVEFATYGDEETLWTRSNNSIELIDYVDPIKPNGASSNGCDNPWANASYGHECNILTYEQPSFDQCKEPGSCRVFHCTASSTQWSESGLRNIYQPANNPCSNTSTKVQTSNITACLTDPNETDYIAGGGAICPWQSVEVSSGTYEPVTWDGDYDISGPNITCPSPMLAMSESKTQILDAIGEMSPVPGGTLADVGLMWGYRMLSDDTNWQDFWGYETADMPLEFGSSKVRKMLVLLSDGVNEPAFHFEGYYGCLDSWVSGWSQSGRWWTGNCFRADSLPSELNNTNYDLVKTGMDNLMLDACKAIREQDVELYTIALDLDAVDDADGIEMLEKCADGDPSDPDYEAPSESRAFNISAAELDATFQDIAQRALRLSE